MEDVVNGDVTGQIGTENGRGGNPLEAQPAETGDQPDLTSTPAVEVAPQPAQPDVSQYLTRAELAAISDEIRRDVEQELWRKAQSKMDKDTGRLERETAERLKTLDVLLKSPSLAPYLGDDAEKVRQQFVNAEVESYFQARAKPPEPEPQAQPDIMDSPIIRGAIELTGVQPTDPEFVDPHLHANDPDERRWVAAMKQAAANKQKRLAARQQPKPTPQPVPQPPKQSAPVSIGTGEAPKPIDVSEAITGYRDAIRRGDHAAAKKFNDIIDSASRG